MRLQGKKKNVKLTDLKKAKKPKKKGSEPVTSTAAITAGIAAPLVFHDLRVTHTHPDLCAGDAG